MKRFEIITVLAFIVLGIGAGLTGDWGGQETQETQETQITEETQETQETQITEEAQETQETQEVDPWANWQEPTTVLLNGETILINNGKGMASTQKWVIVDENSQTLEVGGQVTSMHQWPVQFQDGEFGHLVFDENPAGAGNTGWSLVKGVN